MVEIIVCERSSICWHDGGTDNGRQKTQKSWLWHHWAVLQLLDHPRKLVTLNPKLKSTGAGRYQLLYIGGMPTASSLAWRLLSEKSQDAVALQQIKERGALPMIDRGDIRQAIDRCSNIWASLPGAGYGQFRHGLTAWLQNSKRAERSEIDVWAESPRLSPLWLYRSSCLSWAVNHYRDNAFSKPAHDHARELKLANATITDMQMRQRDVAALDAKSPRS